MPKALEQIPARPTLRIVPGALELKPQSDQVLRGNARAIAVKKFRELARRIESGELNGARVQWRRVSEGEPDGMEVVEMSSTSVSHIVYRIEG